MASLQTNAVLPSPNTANTAVKANTQPAGGGKDDFATMLSGGASRPAEKSKTPSKPDDSKSAAPQPHAQTHIKAKREARADNKADNKKADNKPEHKSAAATDDAAKPDSAKPAAAARPQQTADAADAGSDTADNNADAGTQTAANQNSGDPAAAQTAAQVPPAPLPQLPLPDASVQAQQMLAAAPAAATPAAGAQAAPATTPANDNNNVTGAATKIGRAQGAPPTPVSPDSIPAAGAPAATAKPTAGNPQDFLKAAGHQDGKSQIADAAKTDALQPTVANAATPQPAQPAPQPAIQAAQPAPASLAANVAGVTAPAAANNNAVAAHAGPAANLHVAPQGPTPNVNSLAVEIAARSQSGSREFQIRLDPPELGHVEVRLSIDASGKAEAHMTADQQQTLDLLQKNSPSLTSALRDAGLDVSQSGLNFSLKGQDRQGEGSNGGAQARGHATSLAATRTIDAVQSANPYLSSAGDARLDIHV